jgi:anti-anti-sigma factor
MTVSFETDRTVVDVGGEIDMLTAPTMGALLRALVDQGHQPLVLDFARLTFMDASGLSVIVDIAGRLARSAAELRVRSVPAFTQRILDIAGVSGLLRLEALVADPAGLGPEGHAGDGSAPIGVLAERLPADLARVREMRSDTKVLDAALRLVTALAAATVEGADGVSVTLERSGRLRTVASSNETILRMDEHQYATGEGPCLSAAAEGRWFHVESLAAEDRWPAFVPRALEEGVASILSTPLMDADGPVGALNIYSRTDGAFGTTQQELAALFAGQASGILAGSSTDVSDQDVGTRIANALAAREVIAQAQGVYMARQSVSAEDAAAAIHRSAREREVSVLVESTDLVGSTHRANRTSIADRCHA